MNSVAWVKSTVIQLFLFKLLGICSRKLLRSELSLLISGKVEGLLKAKLLSRIMELSMMETIKLNVMLLSRVTLKSIMLNIFSIIYLTLD